VFDRALDTFVADDDFERPTLNGFAGVRQGGLSIADAAPPFKRYRRFGAILRPSFGPRGGERRALPRTASARSWQAAAARKSVVRAVRLALHVGAGWR
jgi:hypothetical protein